MPLRGLVCCRTGPNVFSWMISTRKTQEVFMSAILLIVLVLLLVGAWPSWPYSRSWGYYPSGGLGLVVVVLLVLLLAGRL
jgi:CDP-diglyceride synthetase